MDSLCWILISSHQWGKDKTPSGHSTFDTSQPFSPATQTPGGFPGTPQPFFPQYGGEFGDHFHFLYNTDFSSAQYGQQQGFGGPTTTQSPAGYGAQPLGFGAPPSAGGFGRGQQPPAQTWTPTAGPNQNFNGFAGYQG